MKYLLDTCCVSDFIRGNTNTQKQLLSKTPAEIAVSAITIMELSYGLFCHPELAKKIKKPLNDFLSRISIIPYGQEDAYYTTKMRSFLRKKGQPIGSYDILIAGTALHHALILVTDNQKEFNRIPELKLENWR